MKMCQGKWFRENETKSYTYETISDNRVFTCVSTSEDIVKNILTRIKTTTNIGLISPKCL